MKRIFRTVALLVLVASHAGAARKSTTDIEDAGVQAPGPEASTGTVQHLPYALGRMYPMSSADVHDAVLALVKELKLGLFKGDDAGVAVTKEKRFSGRPGSPPKPITVNGVEPRQYQIHLFVPQAVEPARVYVDTLIIGRFRDGRLGSLYGTLEVNQWFFEKLGDALGISGYPIPLAVVARRELADRLLGEVTERHAGEPYEVLHGITNPKRIRASYVQPVYPGDDRVVRRRGKVYMHALLTEGGYMQGLSVLRSTNPDGRFHDAAPAAVRFWRYEPAQKDGKPVSTYMTVIVEFAM